MTRVILHIGDGKCGSSAIQAALWEARGQLEAHGILYRAGYRQSGHFALVKLLGASVRGNGDRALSSSAAVVAEIRARLAEGGVDHLVLSAESFFARRPEEVLDLVAAIAPGMSGADVLAYVREPADMYLSWLQQELKGNHRFVPPRRYRHPLAATLLRWRSHPMVTSLTVRPFERSALVDGSVVPDFAAQLSRLTGRRVTLSDRVENTSLTAEQIVALQAYRERHLPDLAGKRAPASDRIVAMFNRMNAIGRFGSRPRLQQRWADLIRARAADDLRALCAVYPDCSLLLRPVAAAPELDPPARPRDARSVLEPVDAELVRLLQRILPPPDGDGRTDLPPEVARTVRVLGSRHCERPGEFARIVRRAWQGASRMQGAAPRPGGAERDAAASPGSAGQRLLEGGDAR